MQLEAQSANALYERDLDKVVYILGSGMVSNLGLACFRSVIHCNRVQCGLQLCQLNRRENTGGKQRRRVGLAGSNFLVEELPVKDDGTLPLLEFRIERLAKAARPHLHFTASFCCASR